MFLLSHRLASAGFLAFNRHHFLTKEVINPSDRSLATRSSRPGLRQCDTKLLVMQEGLADA